MVLNIVTMAIAAHGDALATQHWIVVQNFTWQSKPGLQKALKDPQVRQTSDGGATGFRQGKQIDRMMCSGGQRWLLKHVLLECLWLLLRVEHPSVGDCRQRWQKERTEWLKYPLELVHLDGTALPVWIHFVHLDWDRFALRH